MSKIQTKWVTVLTHRSYRIMVLQGATNWLGYIVDDPAFHPYTYFYNTVIEAMEDIDKKTI